MTAIKETNHLGELFKLKRKELNLSLKEVENATSIRMGFLQAIEDGEMSKLISPVYAKGFIKQYATFLGLDGEKIVREHAHVFRNVPPQQECAYGLGTLEMRGSPGGGVKWLPNAVWVAVSIFVLIGAWLFAKYLGLL